MKIYIIKISDINEKEINELYLLINLEKKHGIEKLKNKKDKVRKLIGEIFIRKLINEELGIKNRDIIFDKNIYGKPYLKHYQKFNFNISHSGDFLVCAIDDKTIGIDIEEVINIEYKELAKNFFTASEFNYIINSEPQISLSKFYEIWTLKESYIKCCGKGITIPLNSFCIDIDEYENIKVIIDNKTNEYIFKKYYVESNYIISVCSINKDMPNNILAVNQKDLISNFLDKGYN